VIGLDTNVLVRYLTQDDPTQSARATELMDQQLSEAKPRFVGLVALVGTAWVLQRLYRASAQEIRETVTDLLGSRAIVMENRDVVARALTLSKQNSCSFADGIIAASVFALAATRSSVLTVGRCTLE
jgi:predicted nucleic-acid-binding protein